MTEPRDVTDQISNGVVVGAPTVEGIWRNGIRPAADAYRGGVAPVVNAEMLERFAGVSGGGESGGFFRGVNGAPNGSGLSLMSGLGAATGLYGAYTGFSDMIHGKTTADRALGGANGVVGSIGAAGSIANMFGASSGFLGGLTSMGGAGLGGGGLAGNVMAGSTWVGTAAGGGGATAAGLGTLATTGAAVAGAGLAGYGVGTAMSNASDSNYTRTGLWGYDESGRPRSAMDAATNWGMDYDRAHGVAPGDWSAGGAARAVVGGIGAGVVGSGQALWNWATS